MVARGWEMVGDGEKKEERRKKEEGRRNESIERGYPIKNSVDIFQFLISQLRK
jgi:hypothetical protein